MEKIIGERDICLKQQNKYKTKVINASTYKGGKFLETVKQIAKERKERFFFGLKTKPQQLQLPEYR